MKELVAEYCRKAGDKSVVRAVELFARDLARGDRATYKQGYSPEAAVNAAIEAFRRSLGKPEFIDDELRHRLVGKIEAWVEGRQEPDPRDAEDVLKATARDDECIVFFNLTSYEKSILEGSLHYGIQEFSIIGYDGDADTAGVLLERLADQVPQGEDDPDELWSVKLPEGSGV